jgi:hypothetical protein
LGLPWLEKHNPIIDWKEKTLEFWDSKQDKIKASLRSAYQRIDRAAMPDWDHDLVVRYLSSHKGSETMDQWWKDYLFEDIGSWSEDEFDQVTIRRYTPAQQMEHKYHQTEEVQMLPPEYAPWKDVFEKKASEWFPESRSWDHQIEVNEDFIPKRGKIYPLSPKQQNTLDEWIKEHLEKGYIWQSKSPQAAPFFFVEKKDKQLQPCQDYRYLNSHTKPNTYPLPLITDLMLKLKGSQYFMKLDIRWGYNNVQIKESDQWKAAFVTNRGLFELNVMFFGLHNSPATFQAMMDNYFRDLTDKGHVVIYMDDILCNNFIVVICLLFCTPELHWIKWYSSCSRWL